MRTEKAAVQAFYDRAGWRFDEGAGAFTDGAVFDDLRPVTAGYRRRANARVRAALPAVGQRILDAASGAIQYEDYVGFSQGYGRRVCVDLSRRGLRAARQRVGDHGLFVQADVTALPFAEGAFDAVVSLHTIYHVPEEEQATFLHEIARVLCGGGRAVVVSTWTTSPWDAALRLPLALGRRARALLARLGLGRRAGGPVGSSASSAPSSFRDGPGPPGEAASLYFHPTRRSWLRRAVPPALDLSIRCWRSVGVPFLRRLGGSDASRRFLARLARLEDAWPAGTGLLGVYPLLVLDKEAD